MTAFPKSVLFAAGAAALLGGPLAGLASAQSDEVDELAKGEWEGKRTFAQRRASGSPTPVPVAPTTPPPQAPPGGTATEPTGDAPGEPAGPDGGGPTGGGSGEDDPSPVDPTDPTGEPPVTGPVPGGGGGGPVPPLPGPLPTCGARWQYVEEQPMPDLYMKQTTLTLVLFRNDQFAFICNAYARAISTYYLDWFMSTLASRDDSKQFKVTLELVGECPNCNPRIDLLGISAVEARAQVKCRAGWVDRSSFAKALAGTTWAGPLKCDASANAAAAGSAGATSFEVEYKNVKIAGGDSSAFVSSIDEQGKGDCVVIQGGKTKQIIRNHAAVTSFAAGCDDNCQSKARVGYELDWVGTTSCGNDCLYLVALEAK